MIREVVKATGDIITVAGNGTDGYSGDNGPATAAELDRPQRRRRRRRGRPVHRRHVQQRDPRGVKATGDIITVAGNGTGGYSGDNGPATAAELDDPYGVAVDAAGDLFIADNGQQRDPRGRQGDRRHHHRRRQRYPGLQRRQRTRDRRRAGRSRTASPSTPRATCSSPTTCNNVIREVVKATGDIITVAGNGTDGYSGDNGPATAAELDDPVGVAVDAAGDLFIADTGNNVVRQTTPAVTVTIQRAVTTTALVASTAAAASGPVGHLHRDGQRLGCWRGNAERGTVTFSDQNGPLASEPLSNGVATFTTTSLAVGTYTVTASFSGNLDFASSTTATAVPVTISLTHATFLKQDTTTEGNWINTYGTQGYEVIGNATSLPSYATVTPSGQKTYTWTTSTTDPRALQDASGTGRIAAAWYSSTSFTVDVDFTDGKTHDLELYFVDWDSTARSEQVQISDASTGAVLDTETVSSFHSGVYDNWQVSGNVLITITNLTGANAVLSGLFIDPTPRRRRSSSRTRRRRETGSIPTARRAMRSSATRPASPPTPPSPPAARRPIPGRPAPLTPVPSRTPAAPAASPPPGTRPPVSPWTSTSPTARPTTWNSTSSTGTAPPGASRSRSAMPPPGPCWIPRRCRRSIRVCTTTGRSAATS